MDEDAGSTEFDLASILEKVGSDSNGPQARTSRVYQYLAASGKFTNWDLLCFCAEYVGSMVGTMPWLEAPARHLVRLVYMAHYVRFEAVAWQDKSVISAPATSSETDSTGESTTGR